jgi:hypothetical protein
MKKQILLLLLITTALGVLNASWLRSDLFHISDQDTLFIDRVSISTTNGDPYLVPDYNGPEELYDSRDLAVRVVTNKLAYEVGGYIYECFHDDSNDYDFTRKGYYGLIGLDKRFMSYDTFFKFDTSLMVGMQVARNEYIKYVDQENYDKEEDANLGFMGKIGVSAGVWILHIPVEFVVTSYEETITYGVFTGLKISISDWLF